MPTIPLTKQAEDIFSYGFSRGLLRQTEIQTLDTTNATFQSAIDPTTIPLGRELGGWTIGQDRLYNQNIEINAKTGIITVGDSNITIDGNSKQILINDGSDDRVLIGYDSGGF